MSGKSTELSSSYLTHLTALSALRDRDALDWALVDLIQEIAPLAYQSVRLIHLVGEDASRCLIRAQREPGSNAPASNQAWTDWRPLPRLIDYPARAQAAQKLTVTTSGNGPYTHVFPFHAPPGSTSLIEIESLSDLTDQERELTGYALTNYQNILALLDYGEKDSLTELLNRKPFDTTFYKAVTEQESFANSAPEDRRHPAEQASYWLAVIDIDFFKHVNDTHGHLIGDEVLLLMARLMRRTFRLVDKLYRFGGEEFVVLMRCTGPDSAAEVMERFRAAVQAHTFPQVGSITISAGFDELRPQDTPTGAFGRADLAVYHAKTHGRNQVCCYTDLVKAGALQEPGPAANDVDLF